jgi:Transferase family
MQPSLIQKSSGQLVHFLLIGLTGGSGNGPSIVQSTQIPRQLTLENIEPLGTPLPWEEWVMGAPVDHYVLYFAPKEVQRMWEAAVSSGTRVSHFEALPAHVWSLMMRNRELQHEEQAVNMNLTLGARRRVFPALPETYLGSPIILTRVTGTKAMSLQALANSIRSSIAHLTPSNVSALFHYKDSPQ